MYTNRTDINFYYKCFLFSIVTILIISDNNINILVFFITPERSAAGTGRNV